MFDTYERPAEFALIEAIAAAIREELGVAIEDQPGFQTPERGRPGQPGLPGHGPDHPRARSSRRATTCPAVVTWVLRRLARRRLAAGGLLDAREVEHLLGLELDGRDDWLAFLILVPWSEIEHLAQDRRPGARLDLGSVPDLHLISSPITTTNRRHLMTLAERLSEYVRACFTGLWVQIVRARRRDRRDRPPLPPAGLDPGHLGHRPRPEHGRPDGRLEPGRQRRPTRWPRSGRSGPWPPPTARRCSCSGTSTGS